MRRSGSASALLLATALLAGCGTSIGGVNLRPELYYQQEITLRGRITRMQTVGGITLLELADAREHRILVRVDGQPTQAIGDWVKATGVLVPETRVGDQVVYDVLQAETLDGASAPWLDRLT